MKNFEYVYPKNAATVPALLSEKEGQSLLYAGGTDAIARLKEGIDTPEQLINLKAVKELNFIKTGKTGLRIGAATPLSDLIENADAKKYPGLIKAAQSIGTIQLRNMGTVGGNLCQRPRCWYFRSRHFPCLRKHGDTCFAIYGENKYHAIIGGNPCFIVHPSDLAPMLIALDARIKISSPKGIREITLEEFFVLPEQDPYHETILKPQELLTEVIVPATTRKSHYLKFRERKSIDFAMVSVAFTATVTGKRLSNLRLVLGGVAPIPWRAHKAEKILEGKEIDDNAILEAGAAELADVSPLDQNEFKVILTKNLLKRAVHELVAA